MKNVNGVFVMSNQKSFVAQPVTLKNTYHLIVLVHGYKGSEFDMRLYKNYIAKIFPQSQFLISSINTKVDD